MSVEVLSRPKITALPHRNVEYAVWSVTRRVPKGKTPSLFHGRTIPALGRTSALRICLGLKSAVQDLTFREQPKGTASVAIDLGFTAVPCRRHPQLVLGDWFALGGA